MTNEEYATTQAQLTMLASIFRMLNVETFLARAAEAQAIAPVVDPTLWRKGHRQLEAMEDLARAALAFKRAAVVFERKMLTLAAKAPAAAPTDSLAGLAAELETQERAVERARGSEPARSGADE